MADEKNGPYQPGTYVKGEETRRVESVRDAVQATFDGFTRQPEDGDVALGTASVNSNDPEAVRTEESGEDGSDASDADGDYEFEQNAEFSDDQAEVLDESHFDTSRPSDSSAQPDS